MTPPRAIAVVSSSRADYAHGKWLLQTLRERGDCALQLYVTGAHLSPAFGFSVDEIEADGLPIDARVPCLLDEDTDAAMGRGLGRAVLGFTELLEERRPDLLVVVADRYEMLAPACAAMTLRIPLAHIEGGERSEAAIDQQVRDALTMMSHLHFTTTEGARQRLLQLGEEAWRVHRVGAGSLDHLRRGPQWDRARLEDELGFPLAADALLASFHPVTLDRPTTDEAAVFLDAIRRVPGQVIWCWPNADAGAREIIERARQLAAERPDTQLLVNAPPTTWWSLLQHAAAICGNSSSVLMESGAAGVPAVNVGRRQQGREAPGHMESVPAEANAIVGAIGRARRRGRQAPWTLEQPYGDGRAAERIARVLLETPIDDRLRIKTLAAAAPAPSA